MDDLDFFYEYIREFQEMVIPKEELKTDKQTVEKMIDAIGEVTLNSKSAINAARAAYKALTANQKELVSNYGVLLDAIAAYEELTGGEGTIHIGASEAAASNGEENPNTGAEVFGA